MRKVMPQAIRFYAIFGSGLAVSMRKFVDSQRGERDNDLDLCAWESMAATCFGDVEICSRFRSAQENDDSC